MAEINYQGLMKKYFPEKTLEKVDELNIDEQNFLLAKELLEKLKPIVETRQNINKEQVALSGLLVDVIVRLDKLIDMKNANTKKESEVLDMLKQEILG